MYINEIIKSVGIIGIEDVPIDEVVWVVMGIAIGLGSLPIL
jgi:hypothetical protein